MSKSCCDKWKKKGKCCSGCPLNEEITKDKKKLKKKNSSKKKDKSKKKSKKK